jgi:hypothetical protein
LGKTVTKYGVHIVGEANLAALVAADASSLYARNVFDFLKLIVDANAKLVVNMEDDIVAACLMCRDGHLKSAEAPKPAPSPAASPAPAPAGPGTAAA